MEAQILTTLNKRLADAREVLKTTYLFAPGAFLLMGFDEAAAIAREVVMKRAHADE